ncbi:ubiquitin carboxyl-terminal hydrolase [Wuchereria bancrofti]|uniref:ubiquitinyl hydrolase 1 n=1 Tax=Wuchereria bancrofti TaxID=6293 RepID=J9EWR9_WUCBA|nr:ubiquitin carboxyl-terminal hydrolase [Wuchereria bancrofti]
MAKKRLKRNAKKYETRKRVQSIPRVTPSSLGTDGADVPNSVISKSQPNVDSRIENEVADILVGISNEPIISEVPFINSQSSSKRKTHIRFRPMNAATKHGFNSHNDVWQPSVIDIGMNESQIYPRGENCSSLISNKSYKLHRNFWSQINNGEPPISRSFRCLLQALWSEERNRCINPQLFLAQIRHQYPQFRGPAQQDAQEFIRCLLDILHRELRQPVFAWEYRNMTRSCNIQTEEESISGFIRSGYVPSRSSSSVSDDDDERYETADSGWSSDGEVPTASKTNKHSEPTTNNRLTHTSDHSVNQQESAEMSPRSRQSKSPIYYRSLVTEVFDGRLSSVVKCLTCHHLSETCETFQDLSLSIPTREQLDHIASYSMNLNSENKKANRNEKEEVDDNENISWQWPWWFGGNLFRSIYHYLFGDLVSLNDALAAFFLPDDLCGENMYSCEKCSKLRNGVKICKIIDPPEILCIHLKRFRHELSYSVKVRSGHYVAYCKNEVDDNWYEFDDTVVTRLEIGDILSKEAYVLFYQRQSSQSMDDIRIRVRQMLEENDKIKVPLHRYISREWLHRFSTFSNPGPITNYDFLCQHSQILPRRAASLTDYYATISSSLWDFLYEKFGGGPASSELHYCLTCQNDFQIMKHKREIELTAFLTLEGQLKRLKNNVPALTYGYYMPANVIAKAWIDKWKAFVEENEFEPPGSIDNNIILVCSSNTCDARLHLRPSQYVELPREAWLFLQSIYGGGPELLCIPEDHPSLESLQKLIAKVNEKIVETLESLKRRNAGGIPLSSHS